jgi:hypothetical protein
MFKRLLLATFIALGASQAHAQAPVFCPTRPAGDNSNACASTAWVQAHGGGGGGSGTVNSGTGGQLTYYATTGAAVSGTNAGTGVLTALGIAANSTGGFPTVPVGFTQGGTGLTTLGTSGQCLVTNSGATAMMWAACATGSGSGTVSSGTIGQIAYYASTGTTVSGEAVVPFTAGGTGLLALGTSNQCLTTNNSATAMIWATCAASNNMIVGTTAISGGTSGNIEYNNANVLGEKAVTGTGSVVLATSPTLVTPALGTPASGTLTNATGYTIAHLSGAGTGVLASLAIANGTAGGYAAVTGTLTTGHCLNVGTGGTIADAGGSCTTSGGSGTVSSGTSGQLAQYAATGTTVSGLTVGAGVITALGIAANGSGGFATSAVTTLSSLTSIGTIATGTWQGTAIGFAYGGTGLTALGTANQCLITNAGVTAMAWASCSGSGSGTVNSGTSGQLAYYASTGTAVSGTAAGTGVLTALGNSTNAASGLATIATVPTANDCVTWSSGIIDSGLGCSSGRLKYTTMINATGVISNNAVTDFNFNSPNTAPGGSDPPWAGGFNNSYNRFAVRLNNNSGPQQGLFYGCDNETTALEAQEFDCGWFHNVLYQTNGGGSTGLRREGDIASSCSNCEIWGGIDVAHIVSGGDGQLIGDEIDVQNNGSYVPNLTTNFKVGLWIAAMGSTSSTAAIGITGFSGATFNYGFHAFQSALTNGTASFLFYGSTSDTVPCLFCVGYNGFAAAQGWTSRNGATGSYGANHFNIFWTGSAAQLWIDSTNEGSISLTSDPRVKHNIEPMADGALDKLMKLRPVTFNWADVGIYRDDFKRHSGLLTTEVQPILPEAVEGELGALTTDGDPQPQSLEPLPLIALLIKSVQELKTEVKHDEEIIAAQHVAHPAPSAGPKPKPAPAGPSGGQLRPAPH